MEKNPFVDDVSFNLCLFFPGHVRYVGLPNKVGNHPRTRDKSGSDIYIYYKPLYIYIYIYINV